MKKKKSTKKKYMIALQRVKSYTKEMDEILQRKLESLTE